METVSTKVPTPVKEQLDEMAEEIGESRSIVIRNLLREGLDEQEADEGTAGSFPFFLAFIGWTAFVAAFFDAEQVVGLAGLALAIGGIAAEYTDFFSRVQTTEND